MTVEQFIKKNAELLDADNGIYRLYSIPDKGIVGVTPAMITQCLLEYGLNPLEWMLFLKGTHKAVLQDQLI